MVERIVFVEGLNERISTSLIAGAFNKSIRRWEYEKTF